MDATVAEHAPELGRLARELVGDDPFALAGEGTAYAQPAILCAGLAAWAGAGSPAADVYAGHSLGELTALVAAGRIGPEDGVRLAVERGRLMQAAAERSPGGMVALLGDAETARRVAGESGLRIANDNGPTQLVAAGPTPAVAAAVPAAKAAGIRAIELAVAGAFHTAALDGAVGPYREALARVDVRGSNAPVFSSATAEPFPADADGVRGRLAGALTAPVRWRETMDAIRAVGVDRFVEAGPGKALTGMVKRALNGVEATVLRPRETARA